jgi:peptidoglycan hydrolase-like protein with peptidoglycan-binding domain
MLKSIFLRIAFLFLVLFQANPSFADDDVKRVVTGVLGALIAEGLQEANSPQQSETIRPEDIQWVNPHQDQPVQAVESNSDRARAREIQAALTKIGFYYGEIDGISGSGTSSAIQSWEAEFDQTIDGYLTESEFGFLKKVSDAGFSNYADYQDATKAGIQTRKEYERIKKEGEPSVGAVTQAEEVGIVKPKNSSENLSDEMPIKSSSKSPKCGGFFLFLTNILVFFGKDAGCLDLHKVLTFLVLSIILLPWVIAMVVKIFASGAGLFVKLLCAVLYLAIFAVVFLLSYPMLHMFLGFALLYMNFTL